MTVETTRCLMIGDNLLTALVEYCRQAQLNPCPTLGIVGVVLSITLAHLSVIALATSQDYAS